MKKITLAQGLEVSAVAMGGMRLPNLDAKGLAGLVQTAIEGGINFFDHADIYGGGKSETMFASAVADLKLDRSNIFVQTKCGIRNGFFDFSTEHIVSSLEGSLKRLNMDYVDLFLLHRPDALVDPAEVAEAFDKLHKAGKARYFGVSNHNAGQIKLLQKHLGHKLIVNQLQFSPVHTGMLDAGLNVNMTNSQSFDHDGSVLDFCRLEGITVQAWSPFLYGYFEGVFLGSDKYPELNKAIAEVAEEYDITKEATVVAWILRHPASMQAIPGTTNATRLAGICKGSDVVLSRQDWYKIYRAAGNRLP